MCRKTSDWRNGVPMMLMMLAQGASIISIIGGSFLHEGMWRGALPANLFPPIRPVDRGSVLVFRLCEYSTVKAGVGYT